MTKTKKAVKVKEMEAENHKAVVSLRDAMNMVIVNACKLTEMLNDSAYCETCGGKPFSK